MGFYLNKKYSILIQLNQYNTKLCKMFFSRTLSSRFNILSRQARNRVVGQQGNQSRLMSTHAIDAGFKQNTLLLHWCLGFLWLTGDIIKPHLQLRMESYGASTVKDDDVLKYRAL